MKSKRKQFSILWAILFLALAETGLRIPASTPTDSPASQPVQPVVTLGTGNLPPAPFFFALGSSRTRRALDPVRIENELTQAGVNHAWVSNLSYVGITMPFLFRTYVDELRPLVQEFELDGVVAIEVRGSALNDSYLTSSERVFIKRGDFEPLPVIPDLLEDPSKPSDVTDESSSGDDSIEALLDGDLEDSAREWMQSLYIMKGRTETLRWIDQRLAAFDNDSTTDASPVTAPVDPSPPTVADPATPEDIEGGWTTDRILSVRKALSEHRSRFTRGSRGFEPIEASAAKSHLNTAKWRARYRDELLLDFKLGGIQSEMLRRLVAAVQQDGLRVVLYLLPITDIHRGFYAPGDYDRMVAFLERLADHMRVPFVNLDKDHEYTHDDFQDTHHLGPSALERISHDIANRVFLAPAVANEEDPESSE